MSVGTGRQASLKRVRGGGARAPPPFPGGYSCGVGGEGGASPSPPGGAAARGRRRRLQRRRRGRTIKRGTMDLNLDRARATTPFVDTAVGRRGGSPRASQAEALERARAGRDEQKRRRGGRRRRRRKETEEGGEGGRRRRRRSEGWERWLTRQPKPSDSASSRPRPVLVPSASRPFPPLSRLRPVFASPYGAPEDDEEE